MVQKWSGRRLIAAGVCLTAAFLGGCSGDPPPPPSGDGEGFSTYRLLIPQGEAAEQGGETTITIEIERAEKFGESVHVKLVPPKGITADPDEVTVDAGQATAETTLSVGSGTRTGRYEVGIEATSAGKYSYQGTLDLTVTESTAAEDDEPEASQ